MVFGALQHILRRKIGGGGIKQIKSPVVQEERYRQEPESKREIIEKLYNKIIFMYICMNNRKN